MDVSRGAGGVAVRYDERFSVQLEARQGEVVARAAIGGLVQEWRTPFAGSELDLHVESRKPAPSGGLATTSDEFHLAATIDGVRTELAVVDGRFLSSEVTESFTGRVIGVYAVEGEVAVSSWVAEGDDE